MNITLHTACAQIGTKRESQRLSLCLCTVGYYKTGSELRSLITLLMTLMQKCISGFTVRSGGKRPSCSQWPLIKASTANFYNPLVMQPVREQKQPPCS